MRQINQQAWAILKDDEKSALSLQIGLGKSSWQSGEIMRKSHYKYLEIEYRAKHFLKMFTEHFLLFEQLIPTYVKGNRQVIEYFNICMSKRLKPVEAIRLIKTEKRIIKSDFNQKIEETLKTWEKDIEHPYSRAMYDLVKEYDRWNNFRILPRQCREPSAYKRRTKNIFKKHIRIIATLNPLSIERLLKLYQTKRKPYVYLPLVDAAKNPVLYQVKVNQRSLEIFNTIGLYLFNDIKHAEEYIYSVSDYIKVGKKHCNDGLQFWPKYREYIIRAMNYEAVQKISPTRRHLQLALQKFTFH